MKAKDVIEQVDLIEKIEALKENLQLKEREIINYRSHADNYRRLQRLPESDQNEAVKNEARYKEQHFEEKADEWEEKLPRLRRRIELLEAGVQPDSLGAEANTVPANKLEWLGKSTELAELFGFLQKGGWFGGDLESLFRLVAAHFVGRDQKSGEPKELNGHSLRNMFEKATNKTRKKKSKFESLRGIANS